MTSLPIENVQNYPRPPSLERVTETLRVMLAGEIVAETADAFRVLETHHAPTYYIPRADVRAELTAAHGQSFCEWKGVASYWDVTISGVTASRAAWSYAKPTSGFIPITGYLAFYAALMEACFVGEERVIPQPGDFYGGWLTSNLTGTAKGAPGTNHW